MLSRFLALNSAPAGVTDRDEAAGDQAAENTGKEWSDPELIELGNMLMRGLSIEEIARLLRRDHGEVRDKVVEVARPRRG